MGAFIHEAFTIIEAELMEATQTIVDIYGRFLFEPRSLKQGPTTP